MKLILISIWFCCRYGQHQLAPRLPNLAMFLFNRPTRDLLPKLSRVPVLFDNYENYNTALINRQPTVNEYIDTHENIPFLPVRSTVAVQHKDGETLDAWNNNLTWMR